MKPTRGVRWGLALTWGLLTPFLCLIYLKIPPSPDQMQFAYMAWLSTRGLPYYAGSFDMNWPGAMILHELAVRLFGVQGWSWHLLDFFLLQGITLGGALFLCRSGFRLAPWVFVVLYPVLYVTAGFWMAGQRDIIAVGLLLVAAAATLPGRRFEGGGMVFAGGLVAAAMLIRPTYLSMLVGFLIIEWLPLAGPLPRIGRLRRTGLFLAGFALSVGLTVLLGLHLGNLDDWYLLSFVFTGSVYAGSSPQDLLMTLLEILVGSWHWLTFCAAGGALAWVLQGRPDRGVMSLVAITVAIFLSYVVQNKGFGYHLGGLLTVMTVFCVVLLDRPASAQGRVFSRGLFVAASLLIALGAGKKLANHASYLSAALTTGPDPYVAPQAGGRYDPRPIMEMMGAAGAPEGPMVQYGTTYNVPYLAQRIPSYRFITPAVDMMTPEFDLYDTWMDEVRAGLRDRDPVFVLIEGKAVRLEEGRLVSASGRPAPVLDLLLEKVSTGYRIVYQGDLGYLMQKE